MVLPAIAAEKALIDAGVHAVSVICTLNLKPPTVFILEPNVFLNSTLISAS